MVADLVVVLAAGRVADWVVMSVAATVVESAADLVVDLAADSVVVSVAGLVPDLVVVSVAATVVGSRPFVFYSFTVEFYSLCFEIFYS